MIGCLFKEGLEDSKAFIVGNGGVRGIDVHGKDEGVGAEKLKVYEV